MFAPRGANANFVEQRGPHAIAIRTYERGVEDETLACGTGVVATALIFAATENLNGPIEVLGWEPLDRVCVVTREKSLATSWSMANPSVGLPSLSELLNLTVLTLLSESCFQLAEVCPVMTISL